jgi:SAM-dependent methyltransferase
VDDATRQMEAVWHGWHEQQLQGPLSGTHLSGYARYLGLDLDRLHAGVKVLEIGVGLGTATHEMAARGCEVSVLDICLRAIETVADCIKFGYLHREVKLLPSDHFDLAISHLVTQHMSEADILWQFPEVFRSLKSTGRFLIQWAGSNVPGEDNLKESIVGEEGQLHHPGLPGMKSGRMTRNPIYAHELIVRCGGRLVQTRCRFEWPEYKSYWYATEAARMAA